MKQPAPAPRFSRTAPTRAAAAPAGSDTAAVLAAIGYADDRIKIAARRRCAHLRPRCEAGDAPAG